MHLARIHSEQQTVKTRDHQPLDVMGITQSQRLTERIGKAPHRGVSRPEELRQGTVGAERVAFEIARHVQPIHTAHVLAPAENLADEALHGSERCPACAVLGLGRSNHRARIQQFEVHCGRQPRMEQPWFVGPHRILVIAEGYEAMLDEILQGQLGLSGRDRPVERVELSGIIRKIRSDLAQHVAGDCIRCEGARRRIGQSWRPYLAEALAVVAIEVPLAAFGITRRIEQHAMLASHLPIKEFHA